MLRTALQVGVPSSEEKVTLGFALFFEKFSSTQNSLRLCSSSDGAVAKKVVVTSSSDLMLISILTVSSSELAKGAAALAGLREKRGDEPENGNEADCWNVPEGWIAHVPP